VCLNALGDGALGNDALGKAEVCLNGLGTAVLESMPSGRGYLLILFMELTRNYVFIHSIKLGRFGFDQNEFVAIISNYKDMSLDHKVQLGSIHDVLDGAVVKPRDHHCRDNHAPCGQRLAKKQEAHRSTLSAHGQRPARHRQGKPSVLESLGHDQRVQKY
jgi:hypothetical protein